MGLQLSKPLRSRTIIHYLQQLAMQVLPLSFIYPYGPTIKAAVLHHSDQDQAETILILVAGTHTVL